MGCIICSVGCRWAGIVLCGWGALVGADGVRWRGHEGQHPSHCGSHSSCSSFHQSLPRLHHGNPHHGSGGGSRSPPAVHFTRTRTNLAPARSWLGPWATHPGIQAVRPGAAAPRTLQVPEQERPDRPRWSPCATTGGGGFKLEEGAS